MKNMSYCRFENTLRDLKECYDHYSDHLNSESDGTVRQYRTEAEACDVQLKHRAAVGIA